MNTYYGDLCTKVYESDKSLARNKEVDFYLSFVKDKSMKVLEPMCGNGRLLIPFMLEGIQIDGFDLSEHMLEVCQIKSRKLNLNPNVFIGKIEDFKTDQLYDLIIIPFGSFSLLSDELVANSLTNLKLALKKGGKILLTIVTKSDTINETSTWKETNRIQLDQEFIVEYRKVEYDIGNSLLNTQLRYELIQNEDIIKSEMMDFCIRLYERKEFEELLYLQGFQHVVFHEVVNGYGEGESFNVFECAL